MPKYKVLIAESVSREVFVTAPSAKKAMQKVEDMDYGHTGSYVVDIHECQAVSADLAE